MWRAFATVVLVAGAPAQAGAPPQPLVDLSPQISELRDHVGASAAGPRRAGDFPAVAYAAPDGQTVSVRRSGHGPFTATVHDAG